MLNPILNNHRCSHAIVSKITEIIDFIWHKCDGIRSALSCLWIFPGANLQVHTGPSEAQAHRSDFAEATPPKPSGCYEQPDSKHSLVR